MVEHSPRPQTLYSPTANVPDALAASLTGEPANPWNNNVYSHDGAFAKHPHDATNCLSLGWERDGQNLLDNLFTEGLDL